MILSGRRRRAAKGTAFEDFSCLLSTCALDGLEFNIGGMFLRAFSALLVRSEILKHESS